MNEELPLLQGNSAFHKAGPSLWNKLPHTLMAMQHTAITQETQYMYMYLFKLEYNV